MSEPRLKPNLDATREEKDGRTFYRLVDPSSGREYRLYEVEYFIAQMLDGQTPIVKVAARARDELKFELSPNDLERFVKELSSLGFLVENGAASPVDEILNADDMIDDSASEVDKMTVEDELDRLVRSALLHVKQGLISQARDYFLAAKKYAPKDEKVSVMLNHLDVVGEDDGPSDIEYLWKQAVVLYPDLTQEIGPPGVGVAPIPIDEGKDGMRGGARGSRRFVGIAGAAGLVVIGFVGFMLFGRDLLNPAPQVDVERVRVQPKMTLYFAAEPVEVTPRKIWAQRFDKGGQVVELLVRPGDVVKKEQALARLKLPPAQEKALAVVRQKRQTAEKASLSLQSEIDKLQQEVTKKNEEANSAKSELDGLLARAEQAALKKDVAAAKKKQAAAKKALATLKKKLSVPQKNLQKQQKAFEAAKAAETAFIDKEGAAFLRASDEGLVHKVSVDQGAKVDEKTAVVLLADPSAVHVRFRLDDGRMRALQKDEKTKLVFGDALQADAFVVVADDKGVTVEVKDADGELAKAEKNTVRLVRETIENAFVASSAARVSEKSAYVIEHDFAVKKPVEWVEVRGKEAIAKKGLQAGELVVVGPPGLLKELSDDRVKVTVNVRTAEGGQ